jgi:hypothetical protein
MVKVPFSVKKVETQKVGHGISDGKSRVNLAQRSTSALDRRQLDARSCQMTNRGIKGIPYVHLNPLCWSRGRSLPNSDRAMPQPHGSPTRGISVLGRGHQFRSLSLPTRLVEQGLRYGKCKGPGHRDFRDLRCTSQRVTVPRS